MPRILIVDDSNLARKVVRTALTVIGLAHAEVVEASNGDEAWKHLMAQEEKFNLMLVDMNMPGLNGTDLVRRVRADHRFSTMAIVMVTSETDRDRYKAAVEAGVEAYVTKPFKPRELAEHIRGALEIRSAGVLPPRAKPRETGTPGGTPPRA